MRVTISMCVHAGYLRLQGRLEYQRDLLSCGSPIIVQNGPGIELICSRVIYLNLDTHALHVEQQAIGINEVGLEPEAGLPDRAVENLEQAGDCWDSREGVAIFVIEEEIGGRGPAIFLSPEFRFEQCTIGGLTEFNQPPEHEPAHGRQGSLGP